MSLLQLLSENVTAKQLGALSSFGMDVKEYKDVGNYNLFLIHASRYPFGNYTIGFERKGNDFTDVQQQNMKLSPDSLDLQDLKQIPLIINNWIKQYGTIVIASHNNRKTDIYQKVFKRYGMAVQRETMMGVTFLILNN